MKGEDGSYIGRIKDDGDVLDKNGSYIGRIKDDGDVVDKNGSFIGNVGSMDKAQAAHLFFFRK